MKFCLRAILGTIIVIGIVTAAVNVAPRKPTFSRPERPLVIFEINITGHSEVRT
jgi:hypothetical protein